MTDFTSLQLKVNDLKAKVANKSITPTYLGSLLDDFIKQMKAIDMTGMSDDVTTALQNASDALAQSKSALDMASAADSSSSSAVSAARTALDKSAEALSRADVALGEIAGVRELVSELADSKGLPSGIAPLDGNGRIPEAFLPPLSGGAGGCVGVNVLPFDAVVGPADVYDGPGVAMVDDGVSGQWFTGDFSYYGATWDDYNLRISHAGVTEARADRLFLKLSDEEGHELYAKHGYGLRLSRIGGPCGFGSLSAAEAKEIVTNTFNQINQHE